VKVPYTHWDFDSTTTRLPEFAGSGLGRESNRVAVDLETDQLASGVTYALCGIGGGLTLYMDKGQLVYEYNMMMIQRYIGRSARQSAPANIRSSSTRRSENPLAPRTWRLPLMIRKRSASRSSGLSLARSRQAKPPTSASTSGRLSRSTISSANRLRSTGKLARSR
jgi:hypothetical protein